MTRSTATVNAAAVTNSNDAQITTITKTTINSTVITDGLSITDFFLHEEPKLEIYNGSGASRNVTLVAGSGDDIINSCLGDQVLTIANGATRVIENIEPSRFMSNDGTNPACLYVNFATSFDSSSGGTIHATGTKRGMA